MTMRAGTLSSIHPAARGARGITVTPVAISFLFVSGCAGPQSILDPAGREATDIYWLFIVLAVGAVLIFVLVFGLFVFVARIKPQPLSRRLAEGVIIGGGIVFPVLVLTALLLWTLPLMPLQRTPGDGLRITLTGYQWWWKVEYQRDGNDEVVVAANEIRLPVNARTEIALTADKVIHSFWVPSLAGKMDMFPGRTTRMALEPQKTGIYRGQCAEFCGEAHADMAFQTVVMEPDAFEAWLDAQATFAQEPADDLAARGQEVFLREGCGACHTVRGTIARGSAGPDLTHVGSRESLAAGIMPNSVEAFAQWIEHTAFQKPGVKMPSYSFLTEDELSAIAHYLEGLQ